jgi:beta-phosphoglucomutase-like phosphatase (HAD superfamily)
MKPDALIFDFDGVLLESEYDGNLQLAHSLTGLGYPTTVEQALRQFMGLSGAAFVAAIERHTGEPLPESFHENRTSNEAKALREGIAAVAGAVEFVRSLPRELPRAIASSSTTQWIGTHLQHLGLSEAFGDHIYSGHEHVKRGKPAPDIYLHAAAQLGTPISRCAIIEDSEVGASGAMASGARVIGLVAGRHCSDGHDQRLRDLGVQDIAYGFDDVRTFLALA